MPEEHHLTARNLLEQMNRQFNECKALYHELAVHYGVSDTVFWLLYSLYNSSEPQTQNRLCMEWNLPKQTMNSAVASMVKQGLLEKSLQIQTTAIAGRVSYAYTLLYIITFSLSTLVVKTRT